MRPEVMDVVKRHARENYGKITAMHWSGGAVQGRNGDVKEEEGKS